MKKQYILAVLLLVGAAVVSTMAFPVTDDVHDDFTLYDVSPSGAAVSVSNVRFRVMNKDTCYVKIQLANSGSGHGRFHIILTSEADAVMDPSDFTITYDITATSPGALDVAAASGDDVIIVDVASVHATDDYILLKLVGTDLIYNDLATTDLGGLTIAAYDSAAASSDSAGSYTDDEASDI